MGVNFKMANGTVKWFSKAKGVGFISRENGDDVFVHHTAIQGKGVKTLAQGDNVEFELEQSQKGCRASKVFKL